MMFIINCEESMGVLLRVWLHSGLWVDGKLTGVLICVIRHFQPSGRKGQVNFAQPRSTSFNSLSIYASTHSLLLSPYLPNNPSNFPKASSLPTSENLHCISVCNAVAKTLGIKGLRSHSFAASSGPTSRTALPVACKLRLDLVCLSLRRWG